MLADYETALRTNRTSAEIYLSVWYAGEMGETGREMEREEESEMERWRSEGGGRGRWRGGEERERGGRDLSYLGSELFRLNVERARDAAIVASLPL